MVKSSFGQNNLGMKKKKEKIQTAATFGAHLRNVCIICFVLCRLYKTDALLCFSLFESQQRKEKKNTVAVSWSQRME